MPRLLILIALFLGLVQPARGQKDFLTDYANEQLKNIAPQNQDSFYLVQGRYYYAFYTRESYRRSMECYLEALRLAVHYKHPDIIVKCYFGIGSVYDANNNLPQAVRYYKLHYESVLKARPFNPSLILRATYNIAATYAKAFDTPNAYHYTLKMGQMLCWVTDSAQLNQYRLLIAHIFAGIGKDKEFIEYFSQVDTTVDFRDGELAYGRLYAEARSKYALLTGKKNEVIPPILKELSHTRDSIPLLNLLHRSYAELGDYKNAYEVEKLLVTADMRSMDKSTYGDINYRLLEADNLLKQRENTELQLDEQELRLKSTILYLLLVLVLAGLAIMWYFYRRFRARKKIQETQQHMQEEQEELHLVLLRETHHRVKNNLQIISSMVEMQLNKPEADLYFSMREIQTKMRAIAIAHQMMYEGSLLKDVDMQDYFEKMVDMTLEVLSVTNEQVVPDIMMQGNKLDLDQLVTLALAVNEMLINTVKHVLPYVSECAIRMECKLIAGEYHFTYSDNGTGIPDSNVSTITGTGIRLIHKLARQLDAKILVERETQGKIQYLIIFSKNKGL